jgi:hypothetical protein
MMDEFNGIEDIALPDIIKKQTTTLEIVKNTKKIVIDNNKFHSLMRSIQLNNPRNLKKEILKLPTADMLKYSKINSTSCSKFMSLGSLKTEVDFSISESYLTSVKSHKIRKVIIHKDNQSLNDCFASMFYDFLSEVQDREFTFTFKRSKFDDHCLKNIELLKEQLADSMLFKKLYNVGKRDEICLKLKSFKFILASGKTKRKVYLPFDFITIFSFCTIEQIIFILSQCLENDDDMIRLNRDKTATMVNILPYFNTDMKVDFPTKFKLNKNISFEWVTESKIYQATLYCPKVCFNFINKNISISKYFTHELFLRVYPNEFIGWDKTVLNYLTMDKEFRNAFNRTITSNTSFPTKSSINIDRRYKPMEVPSLEISVIPLVYQYNEELNYFITIQGYRIEQKGLMRTNYNITWKNSITLLKLKKLINLENFINRKTKLDDDGKILFDKNFIDYIDKELIGFFSNEKNDLDRPKLLFHLFEPCINCQTVINGRFNKQKLVFPNEYNEEISKYKDINSIVGFFCKSLRNIVTLMIMEDSNI